MSLTDQINADIKAAMLGKQEAALRALRAVKAALLLAKTDKGANGELNNDEEIKILTKLVKQRKESIDVFVGQGREDLAVTEREEAAVIEKYLPKQLSEEEIRTELQGIISSVGATGASDLGKVMGAASKHFAGRADNKIVSALVKELLS